MAVALESLLSRDYSRWSSTQRGRVKNILRKRDGNACFYCRVDLDSENATVSIEHLDPRSHGGSNSLDNLVLACEPCNNVRASISLVDYCMSVKVMDCSLSEAMDYARMLMLLDGKRRVVKKNNGKMVIGTS